jgi:hypothetical protein
VSERAKRVERGDLYPSQKRRKSTLKIRTGREGLDQNIYLFPRVTLTANAIRAAKG